MSSFRFRGPHFFFTDFLAFLAFGVAPAKPLRGGCGSPKPVALRSPSDSPWSSSLSRMSSLRLPTVLACAKEVVEEARRNHLAVGLHVHKRERVHHLGDHHLVVLGELVLESLFVDEGVVAFGVQELVRVLGAVTIPVALVELGDCGLLEREELLLVRFLPLNKLLVDLVRWFKVILVRRVDHVHCLHEQVDDEHIILLLLGAKVLLPDDIAWLALLGCWGERLPRELGVFEAHAEHIGVLVAHDRSAEVPQCRDCIGLLVLFLDILVGRLERARQRLIRVVDRVVLVEQEGTLEFLLHRRRDRLEFAVSNVAHCAEVWGLDVGNVVLGAVHGELVGDRHAVQNGRNGKSMANFSVPCDFFTHMPGTIEVMMLAWWVNMPPR